MRIGLPYIVAQLVAAIACVVLAGMTTIRPGGKWIMVVLTVVAELV